MATTYNDSQLKASSSLKCEHELLPRNSRHDTPHLTWQQVNEYLKTIITYLEKYQMIWVHGAANFENCKSRERLRDLEFVLNEMTIVIEHTQNVAVTLVHYKDQLKKVLKSIPGRGISIHPLITSPKCGNTMQTMLDQLYVEHLWTEVISCAYFKD
jgi:hypothetical protein